jgi:hypothetical protein
MNPQSDTVRRSAGTLESRILATGRALADALAELVAAIPGQPRGPGELSEALGIDKVLASRLLKAASHQDPIAVLQLAPGPNPLRRVAREAHRCGVAKELVSSAEGAIDEFDQLIREEAGDRSGLQAMISAWLPEARREFELRRKQAVFRAMSQLKGSFADVSLGTVLLHPSSDETKLDIVWLFGLFGLQRLRPGVPVKFASRRMDEDGNPRRPLTIDGPAVSDLRALRLDAFCSSPIVDLEVHEVGDVIRYMLADSGYGPSARMDLVFAEVDLAEIDRFVPAGSGSKGYFFTETTTCAKRLLFDVLVHEDVYPDSEPSLTIYDTASEGVASVNDRSRDFDRFDLQESIRALGTGISKFRSARVPRYAEMLDLICEKLQWDGSRFRGYRCDVEYPVYGSQVTMAFNPPPLT